MNDYEFLALNYRQSPFCTKPLGGVAEVAEGLYKRGETLTAAALAPVYLRMPQAERELKKRQAAQM